MIGVVRVKDGVEFTKIGPAGFRILGAVEVTARKLGLELRVTSACDGLHSGFLDPHHSGEAYDVGSHEFNKDQKLMILNCFQAILPAAQFYCFLESPNTAKEHFHLQRAKGTVYP